MGAQQMHMYGPPSNPLGSWQRAVSLLRGDAEDVRSGASASSAAALWNELLPFVRPVVPQSAPTALDALPPALEAARRGLLLSQRAVAAEAALALRQGSGAWGLGAETQWEAARHLPTAGRLRIRYDYPFPPDHLRTTAGASTLYAQGSDPGPSSDQSALHDDLVLSGLSHVGTGTETGSVLPMHRRERAVLRVGAATDQALREVRERESSAAIASRRASVDDVGVDGAVVAIGLSSAAGSSRASGHLRLPAFAYGDKYAALHNTRRIEEAQDVGFSLCMWVQPLAGVGQASSARLFDVGMDRLLAGEELPEQSSRRRAEISLYHSSRNQYTLYVRWGNSWRTARVYHDVEPGQWTHVCAMYSPKKERVAVTMNGRAVAQLRAARAPPSDSRPHVYVGRSAYSASATSWHQWRGFVADVTLWRRGLSFQEAHALYTGASPGSMAIIGTGRMHPEADDAQIQAMLRRGRAALRGDSTAVEAAPGSLEMQADLVGWWSTRVVQCDEGWAEDIRQLGRGGGAPNRTECLDLVLGSGVNVTADRRWLNGSVHALPGDVDSGSFGLIDARALLEDGARVLNASGFAAAGGSSASLEVLVAPVQHGEQHLSTATFAHYFLLEDSTPVHSSYRACPATGCMLPPPPPPAPPQGQEQWPPRVGYWSDPDLWINRENVVPEEGDDVDIPPRWLVYLDVPTARMESLTVRGTLQFLRDRDLQLLARYIEVPASGAILVGQGEGRPHNADRKAVITVHSGNGQIPMRTLLNGGRIEMRGARPEPSAVVRLWGTARTGSRLVTVEGVLGAGWDEGAEVVVSSSSFESRDAERAVISAVVRPSDRTRLAGSILSPADAAALQAGELRCQWQGGSNRTANVTVLVLDRPLAHPHFGELQVIDVDKGQPGSECTALDLRASVALLSRNVVFEGEEGGGSLFLQTRPSLVLDGVEFRRYGFEHAEITKGLVAVSGGTGFQVRHCAWHRGFNGAIKLSGRGWSIRDSVFFEAQGSALVLRGGRAGQTPARIEGNYGLVAGRNLGWEPVGRSAVFNIQGEMGETEGSSDVVVAGNRCGGADGICFRVMALPRCPNTRYGDSEIAPGLHELQQSPGDASATSSMPAFRDNEAMSAPLGLRTERGCELRRFTAARCSRYGVMHNSKHGLRARGIVLADNRVSLAGNPELSGTRVLLEDSVLVGHSQAVELTAGAEACDARLYLAGLVLEGVDLVVAQGAAALGAEVLAGGAGRRRGTTDPDMPRIASLTAWAPDLAASILGAESVAAAEAGLDAASTLQTTDDVVDDNDDDDESSRLTAAATLHGLAVQRLAERLASEDATGVAAAAREETSSSASSGAASLAGLVTEVPPARRALLVRAAQSVGLRDGDVELALDATQRQCPMRRGIVKSLRRVYAVPDEETLARAVASAAQESGQDTPGAESSSGSGESGALGGLLDALGDLAESVQALLDSLGLSREALERAARASRARSLALLEGDWEEGTPGAAWTGILLPSFTRESQLEPSGDEAGLSEDGAPMHAVRSWPKRPGMSAWRNVTFSRFGNATAARASSTGPGASLTTTGLRAVAISSNPHSHYSCPPVHVARLRWDRVADASRVWMRPPTRYCGLERCDGLSICLLKDEDGSLTGLPGGSVIPAHQRWPRYIERGCRSVSPLARQACLWWMKDQPRIHVAAAHNPRRQGILRFRAQEPAEGVAWLGQVVQPGSVSFEEDLAVYFFGTNDSYALEDRQDDYYRALARQCSRGARDPACRAPFSIPPAGSRRHEGLLGLAGGPASLGTAQLSPVAVDEAARGWPGPVPGRCAEAPGPWDAYACSRMGHVALVIESLDADSTLRRAAPVGLTEEALGATDLLSGPMGLTTFWAVAAADRVFRVDFTGNNPRHIRLQLPDARPHERLTLEAWYSSPLRLEVWSGRYFRDTVPKRSRLLRTVAAHGTNHFDRVHRILAVVLRGPRPLEIRTRHVVQISLTIAVSLDEFFDEFLVRNLASVLMISPDRIKVVDVVPGNGRRALRSSGGDDGGRRLQSGSSGVQLEVVDDDGCAGLSAPYCGEDEGRGACQAGACRCEPGWSGEECAVPVEIDASGADEDEGLVRGDGTLDLDLDASGGDDGAAGGTGSTPLPVASASSLRAELLDVQGAMERAAASGGLDVGYDVLDAAVAGPAALDGDGADGNGDGDATSSPRAEVHTIVLQWSPDASLGFPAGAVRCALAGDVTDPVIVGPSTLDDAVVLEDARPDSDDVDDDDAASASDLVTDPAPVLLDDLRASVRSASVKLLAGLRGNESHIQVPEVWAATARRMQLAIEATTQLQAQPVRVSSSAQQLPTGDWVLMLDLRFECDSWCASQGGVSSCGMGGVAMVLDTEELPGVVAGSSHTADFLLTMEAPLVPFAESWPPAGFLAAPRSRWVAAAVVQQVPAAGSPAAPCVDDEVALSVAVPRPTASQVASPSVQWQIGIAALPTQAAVLGPQLVAEGHSDPSAVVAAAASGTVPGSALSAEAQEDLTAWLQHDAWTRAIEAGASSANASSGNSDPAALALGCLSSQSRSNSSVAAADTRMVPGPLDTAAFLAELLMPCNVSLLAGSTQSFSGESLVRFAPTVLGLDSTGSDVAAALAPLLQDTASGGPGVTPLVGRFPPAVDPSAPEEALDAWIDVDVPRGAPAWSGKCPATIGGTINPSGFSHRAVSLSGALNETGDAKAALRVRTWTMRLPAGARALQDRWVIVARAVPSSSIGTQPGEFHAVFDHLQAGSSPVRALQQSAEEEARANRTRQEPGSTPDAAPIVVVAPDASPSSSPLPSAAPWKDSIGGPTRWQGPWQVRFTAILIVRRDGPLGSGSLSASSLTAARLQTAVGALLGLPPRRVSLQLSPGLPAAVSRGQVNASALDPTLVDVTLRADVAMVPAELLAGQQTGAALLPGGGLPRQQQTQPSGGLKDGEELLLAAVRRMVEATFRPYTAVNGSSGGAASNASLLASSALDRLSLEERALRVGSDDPTLQELHLAALQAEAAADEEEEEGEGSTLAGRGRRLGYGESGIRTARILERLALARETGSVALQGSGAAGVSAVSRRAQAASTVIVAGDSPLALAARSMGAPVLGTTAVLSGDGVPAGGLEVQCPFEAQGERWDSTAWRCVGAPSTSPSPSPSIVPEPSLDACEPGADGCVVGRGGDGGDGLGVSAWAGIGVGVALVCAALVIGALYMSGRCGRAQPVGQASAGFNGKAAAGTGPVLMASKSGGKVPMASRMPDQPGATKAELQTQRSSRLSNPLYEAARRDAKGRSPSFSRHSFGTKSPRKGPGKAGSDLG